MVMTASLWGLDWGTTADWFGAVGTIGAVAVALLFGRRDGKRLDAELTASAIDRADAAEERRNAAADRLEYREERAAEKKDHLQELARQVSFTVSPRDVLSRKDGRVIDSSYDHGAKLAVHNHGPYPIYNVRLVVEQPGDDKPEVIHVWDSVQPGTPVGIAVPHTSPVIGNSGYVSLYFRDVRNNNWCTDIDGDLYQEISETR